MREGWGRQPLSSKCIWKMDLPVAFLSGPFDLQFNCAPTEVNYVQLFWRGGGFFGLGVESAGDFGGHDICFLTRLFVQRRLRGQVFPAPGL